MRDCEYMTVNREGDTVVKCDKRIVFRGELDYTSALCLVTGINAGKCCPGITGKINEISEVLSELVRCEAMEECHEFHGVFGYREDELRAAVNDPENRSGSGLFSAGPDSCEAVIWLNFLRVQIRRCECAAVGYYSETQDKWAESIIKTLNRLSTAVYVLELKVNKGNN